MSLKKKSRFSIKLRKMQKRSGLLEPTLTSHLCIVLSKTVRLVEMCRSQSGVQDLLTLLLLKTKKTACCLLLVLFL